MLKITEIHSLKLNIPLNKPMRTRYIALESTYCLLLKVFTESGIEGQGLIRAASLADIQIMENIIQTIFLPLVIGKSFKSPEQFWQALWLHKRNHLQSSFALYALAAIDIACWDIYAKQANQPLHKLLHDTNDYVIPYGNGGWLSNTFQETQNEIAWYLERGCQYFKMRIGSGNDLQRLKFIRKTFGDELNLLADANQYYDFDSAIEMSKYLADYNVLWFEEPLFSSSITELSKLAQLSPVPIATGENMNSHWQIQDVCELKAAQIIQPDVIYQGGITEFIRSAEIINNANLSMGAHLFHELSASLAGLCKKHYVEHIDFFPDDLFTNDFSIRDGKIMLPQTPGHGVTVSSQVIEKYIIN